MKKTDKLFEDITSNQTLFIETSSNAKTFIKQIETIILEDLDGNKKNLASDFLLAFFGLKTELGPILDWGLEIDKNHLVVDPKNCQTNISGLYAVGDIATYPGKLKLILTGFNEAAIAVHDAYKVIFPEKVLHIEYSTTRGIKAI